jgi:serpin B
MYNGVETKLVSFKMPKFDYSNDLELIDYLKALNIKRAFSSKAQFTRITNNTLMISDVRHSTKVFVNENGVEAAAATSVEFDISDSGESVTLPEHIEFFVNRPFAFVIREASTNAIVFVGAVNQL